MKTEWYKHLTREEQKEFKDLIRAGYRIIERLEEIVREKKTQVLKEITSDKSFDTPAWSEKIAHRLGKVEAYEGIIDLLDLGGKDV